MTKKKKGLRAAVADAARKAADEVKDATQDAVAAATQSGSDAVAAAKDVAKDTVHAAADAASDAKDVATDVARDAADGVKNVAARAKKKCPIGKSVRYWLVFVAIVAATVYGYKTYVAPRNDAVSGGVAVTKEDAMDPKKWSYALGSVLGKQMADLIAQSPTMEDVDMAMVARGVRDELTDASRRYLSDDEVQGIMEKRQEIEREKQVAAARAAKERSAKFVEEYAQREGVKELAGGVLYMAKKIGTGAAVSTNKVKLHYTGRLTDGTEFDSSRKGENPQPVTMSAEGVIPGFATALKAMRVGDVWEVVIPADQAYGEIGAPLGGIGPNEALIFEIEIVDLAQ